MTKRAITTEDIEFLEALQDEMLTQDTVGQADPRFWVVRTCEEEPCRIEDADRFVLVSEDGDEVGELDEYREDVGCLACVPVRLRERNAADTLFLTLRECREHIERNRYHYRGPKPFAMTAWRSPQVGQLYTILQEVDWGELKHGD